MIARRLSDDETVALRRSLTSCRPSDALRCRLAECHDGSRVLDRVASIDLLQGMRAARYWLCDVHRRRMVRFRDARR